MNAWIRSASTTATATVVISSITDFNVDLGVFAREPAINPGSP